MSNDRQRSYNEEFLKRLLARRPEERARYEQLLKPAEATLESVSDDPGLGAEETFHAVLETIVSEERPVLFVRNDQLDTTDVTIVGGEAQELVTRLTQAEDWLRPLLPLVGRVDVTNFQMPYVGTGWFVAADVVVTNRHVASLIARWDGRKFAFNRGIAGRPIGSSLGTTHELDDADSASGRVFAVTEVLYIEPDSGPHDIAFIRVNRRADGTVPTFIPVAAGDVGAEVPVCVVGYPARAPSSVIPDQSLMQRLYRGRFDVKRVAPGYSVGTVAGTSRHDCTTLGGNSGSVVLDLATRSAVGLHFAGLYQETNYAVRAAVLNEYIRGQRWNQPYTIESRPSPGRESRAVPAAIPPASAAATAQSVPIAVAPGGSVTVTIPLILTVALGSPTLGPATLTVGTTAPVAASPVTAAHAEAALRGFWRVRPAGVLAARVGYFDDGDAIGDHPCIAASVTPSQLARIGAAGPREYDGVPIRYLPAEVGEQLDAMPAMEAVASVSYDDAARTSPAFSFDAVDENMDLLLHVGPEYSFDTLKGFLGAATGELVSAMYEFHSPAIKDALEEHLDAGGSLTMVLDGNTFARVRDADEEFDRVAVFGAWKARFAERFRRTVAPKGAQGLIANAYHIKVTVREDDTFWLSSGNWKMGSSQPIITDQERENGTAVDLRGNREWHVLLRNPTLAACFRAHIRQDFQRSVNLGAAPESPSPAEELFVEVPLEESPLLERPAPSRLLTPVTLAGRRKVKPLLTPDREGAVYSEAVLELIESAQRSLRFQIPYISMPGNPNLERGYIDALIAALTRKLTTLDDARVILRTGGSKYSSPTHAAWYFKAKGVDIGERLRQIDNHHTKGMIVDGERVLIGSHNWSQPGVTLNRDASLLFDDAEVAGYYAQAFEIDWERSRPITPRKFVNPPEGNVESVAGAPRPGYRRMALAEYLKDA